MKDLSYPREQYINKNLQVTKPLKIDIDEQQCLSFIVHLNIIIERIILNNTSTPNMDSRIITSKGKQLVEPMKADIYWLTNILTA